MAPSEKALRAKAAETAEKVERLREQYAAKPTAQRGRQLFDARRRASEALDELWAAVPDEKPPSQHLL